MARVYFSGFETGDFLEWGSHDFGGTFSTVQSAIVNSGGYACKVASTAGAGFPFVDSGAKVNLSTAYNRSYIYITAAPTITTQILSHGTPAAVNITQLELTTSRTLQAVNNSTGVRSILGTGTAVIAVNTLTRVEWKTIVGAGTGAVEVYVDGVLDQSYTGLTNNAAGNITAMQVANIDVTFGQQATGFDIYFDDCCIDGATYPGVGKIIARQGTAGTPTYDTWVPNGAATAALCWSNTPFNTGTNCQSVVLDNKQTMLIASFSATQAGHGTETLTSADTITGNKSALYCQTASDGTIDIITRLAGVDNRVTVSIITADSYQETYYTTTLANLNSGELGVNDNQAGAVLQTVYDMWIQTEYIPGTAGLTAVMGIASPFITRKVRPIAY